MLFCDIHDFLYCVQILPDNHSNFLSLLDIGHKVFVLS